MLRITGVYQMSFQAMAWAIKQHLPCQDKMVLLVLANYADNRATCYPSVKRLSTDCGLSTSQIRKCVARLEKLKLVQRYMQMRSYGQTVNIYGMNLDITIKNEATPPTPIECGTDPLECHIQSPVTYQSVIQES